MNPHFRASQNSSRERKHASTRRPKERISQTPNLHDPSKSIVRDLSESDVDFDYGSAGESERDVNFSRRLELKDSVRTSHDAHFIGRSRDTVRRRITVNKNSRGVEVIPASGLSTTSEESTASEDNTPSTAVVAPQKIAKVANTISDDRTTGSEYQRRRRDLYALQRHQNGPSIEAINVRPLLQTIPNVSISWDKPRPNLYNQRIVNSMNISTATDTASAVSYLSKSLYDKLNEEGEMSSSGDFSPGTGVENRQYRQPSFEGLAQSHSGDTELYFASRVLARVGVPMDRLTDLTTLGIYIQDLQNKAQRLAYIDQTRLSPRYCTIYKVIKGNSVNMFLDPPQWDIVEGLRRELTGSIPLTNLKLYLRNHPSIEFIVYRDYNQAAISAPEPEESSLTDSSVLHTEERISLCSEDLIIAFSTFIDQMPGFDAVQGVKNSTELQAPYLIFYHSRAKIEELLGKLPKNKRQKLNIMRDYVLSEYGKEYEEVDTLLSRGTIIPKYLTYLFRPRELIVVGKGRDVRGAFTASILERTDKRPSLQSSSNLWGGNNQKKSKITGRINAWSWVWSGIFSQKVVTFNIELEDNESKELKIEGLEIRPLRFTDQSLIEMLQQRGETFWKCRIRYFVSYQNKKSKEFRSSVDDRYMIDHETYLSLHPNGGIQTNKGGPDVLQNEALNHNEPPDKDFYFLVPPTVKGYNFKTKKWQDLEVDRIRDVTWNKEAFQDLVLHSDQNSDTGTKELLQALITKQIEAGKSTDMIQGKGSGLILLLHGAPGTGKTLTAESVAEIAEKPLYPITCGDVGTEAESVEEYLESAFRLGKKWDCVILLDEADVFLAERSLDDLRRNAIVSAFLRVLEYAEGILILTSNRVGTFDEAFFSRIHLALHYPDLTFPLRERIWKNFINRLRKLGGEDMDFDDLMNHVGELAKNKLNGRQIRNVITTARQHSKWKNMTLNYEFLDQDIRITGRFEEYMQQLRRGQTQGEMAEEIGLRLAE